MSSEQQAIIGCAVLVIAGLAITTLAALYVTNMRNNGTVTDENVPQSDVEEESR